MSLARLAAAAMLGTERGAVVDDAPIAGTPDLLAAATPDTLPAELLRQAAICAVVERAARRADAPELAAIAPCPPEARALVSTRAYALLVQMLDAEEGEVLLESLARVASSNLRVPPALLPRLFDTVSAAARAAVVQAGGETARWLASLNDAWRMIDARDESGWEDGDETAQLAALRAWRERDPAAARAALSTRLPELAPAQRAGALATLAVALSDDDEALLEATLDDKRKEVRVVAQSLLMRLPRSRLAQRATDALRPLVRVEKKLLSRSVVVDPPPDGTTPLKRDGIGDKPPAGYPGGVRAYWLEEIVARTPPAALFALAGGERDKLVALARKHDFHVQLTRGLLRAAIGYGDVDALTALFDAGVDVGSLAHDPDALRRLATLPGSEALLAALIERRRGELPHAWLDAMPRPWSPALSRAVADRVLAAWNDPRQRNIAGSWLPLLALALDPGAGGVPDDWHEPLESWHAGQRSRFLARLLLRRDFHRES